MLRNGDYRLPCRGVQPGILAVFQQIPYTGVIPRDFSVCVRTILPPLRGLIVSHFLPTAYAVGFNLAPLRG